MMLGSNKRFLSIKFSHTMCILNSWHTLKCLKKNFFVRLNLRCLASIMASPPQAHLLFNLTTATQLKFGIFPKLYAPNYPLLCSEK